MFRDSVYKKRSHHCYDQSVAISRETLLELIDLGGVANPAGSRQPIKYFISFMPGMKATI